MLDIELLVLAAEVEADRSEGVQTLVGTGSILTDNHRMCRMITVLVGHPRIEVVKGLAVPTVVDVPAHHVGNLADTYLIVSIGTIEGHGAQAGRILSIDDLFHALGQSDDTVVIGLFLCFGPTGLAVEQQAFVHITPQDDARVVVVLANHLSQVVLCIFIVMRQVGHGVYGRYLFPN